MLLSPLKIKEYYKLLLYTHQKATHTFKNKLKTLNMLFSFSYGQSW